MFKIPLLQEMSNEWSTIRKLLADVATHAAANGPEARSQIPLAGGGARSPKLLLARYSRRAPRCSPLHPAFVNIRGGAAYVDKPRCVALHCSFGE